MSHPRKPRSALGQLLDAAKQRRGTEWPEIDQALGMSKSTRESWLNGNVKDPSLRSVLRLARLLEVLPHELEAAVLDHVLPQWVVNMNRVLNEPELDLDVPASAEAISAKDTELHAKRKRPRR